VSYVDELIGKIIKVVNDTDLFENTRILYTSDHGDNLGSRGLWGKSTMYEEVAGVPMILAGPGVPEGKTVRTPVSHVDCFPTILETVGVPFAEVKDAHPGTSLLKLAQEKDQDRSVLSEYHGMGSTTGAFALRGSRYKYVHYVKYPPQLFDLVDDPEETRNLAGQPDFQKILLEMKSRLLAICDPEEVDARAKRRQAELLAKNGGRAAVLARGDLGFTPAPGFPADFQ
jgi:choline-sulfatase